MGRAFTDAERVRARADILDAARSQFARFGYRKTTIDDVARSAGVAKGTVYLFTESKADLFTAVTMEAEAELRERIELEMSAQPRSPHAHLCRFLRLQFTLLNTHPLLWIVADPREAEAVFRDLSPKHVAMLRKSDDAFFAGLVKDWRRRGLIRAIAPATFASLLRSLYVISLRRDLIGTSEFDSVVAILIESLARELSPKPSRANRRLPR